MRYILGVFFWGILLFTVFRVLLLLENLEQLQSAVDSQLKDILTAFFKGFQYDCVNSGYILALPVLVLSISAIIGNTNRTLLKAVHIYLIIVYSLSFLAWCTDIPFFHHQFCRLDSIIFNWMATPAQVGGMIVGEPTFFIYLFVFVFSVIMFLIIMRRMRRILYSDPIELPRLRAVLIFVVLAVLNFAAIRGRIDAPIRTDNSVFCNNAFLNQLGLNPVFTLIRSYLDSEKLDVLEENVAIANACAALGSECNPEHPLARLVMGDSSRLSFRPNIVYVLMESMSAEKMSRYGNTKNLTPFLDSLALNSICFDQIYSAGVHTYNGVFSSLYSYPAIWRQHSMTNKEHLSFSGFPSVTSQFGYHNIFFTTHDSYFDNLGNFLKANHFNEIITKYNYAQEKVSGPFGAPDHVMFDYAIDKLDSLKEPFFATLLTVSDHGPYHIPEGIPFKPRHNDIHDGVVEYADWSIQSFLRKASRQSWYDSTVFIFVADHGSVVGESKYEMALSFNHVPLIIYSPALLKPAVYKHPGLQIDIFPTVAALMGWEFVNNTMGVDMLTHKRPFAYFSADNKIGVTDGNYYYIRKDNGSEYLFDFRDAKPLNLIENHRAKADSMSTYAFSMIQTASSLIKNKKTGPVSPRKLKQNQ